MLRMPVRFPVRKQVYEDSILVSMLPDPSRKVVYLPFDTVTISAQHSSYISCGVVMIEYRLLGSSSDLVPTYGATVALLTKEKLRCLWYLFRQEPFHRSLSY